MFDKWECPECGLQISKPNLRGPHLSGCRRKKAAKYIYLNGDTKHPYEEKECKSCSQTSLIQKRRDFCSYRCSKLGDNNPSKQKASNHGLSPSVYARLHEIVRAKRGKAVSCINGCIGKKVYHWANITGHYEDIYDYQEMCPPCHDKYDRMKNTVKEWT